MKLRGWHIAGFGSLVDWRQEDLSGGLNVFYGPNEAGKSTLLAFLRFALFGFRPGNTKDPKYPPPPGIRHGGSIFLEDDADPQTESDLSYLVERVATAPRGGKRLRVERANGEEAPESELVRLLGHADRDLFNNVFAFSLTELQSLESLTEKGVQEHIFSAGITGAGRSARDALEQIRKESDELFKGRAKTRGSVLVDQIAQLDEELRAGRERARGYPELAARELELAAKLEALRGDIESRRRTGQRARKLCDLWREIYGPMLENSQQLEALIVSDGFGADPRARLETCTQALERATEQVAGIERETRTITLRLEQLAPDAEALVVRETVATLERDLGLYESQCKDVSTSEQLVAGQEAGLRDALANLGPDWDDARLRETHVSLPIASEATRFEQRLDDGRDRVREIERKIRDNNDQVAELGEAITRETAERDAAHPSNGASRERDLSSEALLKRAAALRGLSAGISKQSNLEVRIDAAREANEAGGSASTNRLRQLCIAAAVLGGGAAAVLFVNDGFRLSSDPFFVAALVTLSFGALGGFLLRGAGVPAQSLSADSNALETELKTLTEALNRTATDLEIAVPPSPQGVEAAAVALESARSNYADREQRQRHIDRLEGDLARTRVSLDTLSTSAQTAAAELETLRDEWTQWGASVGLPATLAPRDVALFAGEVKTARAHLAARDQARSDQSTLLAAIDDWERRVRRVLDESGAGAPARSSDARGEPNLIPAFTKLVRRVREAEERERQRPEVEEQQAAARERADAIAEAETQAREELAELFAQAGAADRDDYLTKLADHERKTQLETKVREQAGELARRIGLGEEAEELRRELETGHVGAWETQASEAEDSVASLQEESDELVRTHRDVENEIDELHGSSDVAALELDRATLQQDLSECVARWRELQIARGLIERTLERFERERQPAVLQEASHHFATVTGGRYPKIVQTAELGGFSVVDVNDERKTPDQLSRGTAEQLYVCIRLGLIAEFSRRAGQLPVAMDDVLVNFDDERALAMANVLADFSQRNACQVLVFTCSSRTRDLFQKAAPEARHLDFDLPASASAR